MMIGMIGKNKKEQSANSLLTVILINIAGIHNIQGEGCQQDTVMTLQITDMGHVLLGGEAV